jgi:hypothetical protein
MDSAPSPASERQTQSITVIFAAVDPYYATVEATMTRKAEIPIAPGDDRPPVYELLARMVLPPGRYELRAALDADTGARAGVGTFVDVPAFDHERLSLSGFAVHADPESMAAPKSAFDALLPFAPTARRSFGPHDHVAVFFQVYRKKGESGPIAVAVRVLDTSGHLVFEYSDDRLGDHRVDLPIDRLQPGRYLFEVTASEAQSSVTRNMPFLVAAAEPTAN